MVSKTIRTYQEAIAIKSAIDKLNKKLGKRTRAKIKRTRDMKFRVYE